MIATVYRNAASGLPEGIKRHPCFDNTLKIYSIVSLLKSEMSRCLLRAVEEALQIRGCGMGTMANETDRNCWLLSLMTYRYGRIYFINRLEAREAEDFVRAHKSQINDISQFLQEDLKGNQIINLAVHIFVLSQKQQLVFPEELIPKFAIQAVTPQHLAVRKEDFIDRSPKDSYQERSVLYDLHDFAHMATVRLSCELYGNKYHPSLETLPLNLKQLISSPGLATELPVARSDGLVFSELLTGLFDQVSNGQSSNDDIVDEMARMLFEYYSDSRALLHPSTGKFMKAGKSLDLNELAVLTQNKSYELPASEMEKYVFVRGGPGNADMLDSIPASDRINVIARLPYHTIYYERRNTLKHRAHKQAYMLFAENLQSLDSLSKEEKTFVQTIIDNLYYQDFYHGSRKNLFESTAARLQNGRTHWSFIGALDRNVLRKVGIQNESVGFAFPC